MPFRGIQNISVLCVEMKLGVTPNGIPMVDLAIALNRNFDPHSFDRLYNLD
jgi:hypothetical protein